MTPSKGSSFNVVEFNRRYEDSRLENKERDTGYSGWLSKAASEFKEASAPIISPKAGATAFNSAFENYTPALDSQSGAIIVKPGELSAGGLTGALLDDDEEVGDYTTEVGGGISGADCRIAHSSQRLASSSWARDEISVDRGTISRITAERSNNITAAASSANLGRDIQLALGGLASR
jgi:hypothetical protein